MFFVTIYKLLLLQIIKILLLKFLLLWNNTVD